LVSNSEQGTHGRELMVYEITKRINKSQAVLQNLRQYWMNNVKNIKKLMAFSKEKERDKKQYKACAGRAMCCVIWK
jgi:hypothetical protein